MKPLSKILITAGAVSLVLALGFAGWWFFTSSPRSEVEVKEPSSAAPSSPQDTAASSNDGAALPPQKDARSPAGASGLLKLSDNPVFDFWLVPETGEAYYVTEEGNTYVAKEGPDLGLPGQIISSPQRIIPTGDGKRVLASFGDGPQPQWGYFDTVDGVWRPLLPGVRYATWNYNEKEVVAVVRDEGRSRLGLISLEAGAPHVKFFSFDFPFLGVELVSLDEKTMFIFDAAMQGIKSRLWRLNPKTSELALLSETEEGLLLVPSSARDLLLQFSSPSSFRVLNTSLEDALPVFISTLPSKCGLDKESLFCFVPRDVPLEVRLPLDYMMRRFVSSDDFLALHIATLAMDAIPYGAGVLLDGVHPRRASDGSYYFLNRRDEGLYRLISRP